MRRNITMRRLTIGEGWRKTTYRELKLYPVLHLQGNWLEDAGFTKGSTVYLFVEDGKIVLKLEPENETESKAIQLFNAINDKTI
jgi:hypothetical protein